jgi:transcription elongation factor Elf1
MDTSTVQPDSSPLSIRCRRCGLADDDVFELTEANTVQSMRCAGCGNVMHFAVMECPRCGAETLFPWASEPSSEVLRNLVCTACEQRYVDEAPDTFTSG